MKWGAAEWCLVILTITVPVCLIGMLLIRIITGSPISAEAGAIIMDMLKVIGGGILGIIGTLLSQNKNNKNDNGTGI